MSSIPPLERSIVVAWPPDAAFRRFTADFGSWWPAAGHSVGGGKVRRVVFEAGLGGRIFEEHLDGRRFQWGRVLAWDPPRLVRFTWHPSREEDPAQQVTLLFEPDGAGTRLLLRHEGWDSFGPKGAKFRRGYGLGWRYVLDVWAGRRTATVRILDVVAGLMTFAARLRLGQKDPRNAAKGEIPRDPASTTLSRP